MLYHLCCGCDACSHACGRWLHSCIASGWNMFVLPSHDQTVMTAANQNHTGAVPLLILSSSVCLSELCPVRGRRWGRHLDKRVEVPLQAVSRWALRGTSVRLQVFTVSMYSREQLVINSFIYYITHMHKYRHVGQYWYHKFGSMKTT